MSVSIENNQLDYMELGQAIKEVFTESGNYTFDKQVPVLKVDGKYMGDFFEFVIFEPRHSEPPIIYHTYSPYDIVSGKSSQYCAIFQSAELLLHAEVSPYVSQRTGVMSSLVLKALGYQDMPDKRVLFVGTGRVARCALAAFKLYFPGVRNIDFMNSGSDAAAFTKLASGLGIEAQRGKLDEVEVYDIIICHSSAKEPVLTPELLGRLKQGAFISSFASEDHMELAENFYNTTEAQVIVDWEQTTSEAVELQTALDNGIAKKGDLILLRDLLRGTYSHDNAKKYTIYRSHGTPMQNLAFLQLLMANR